MNRYWALSATQWKLDFILKVDERHCKGSVVLHFVKVILMQWSGGAVPRVRTPIKKQLE